ncbi:Wzz/FepE/Etk N-terminal domain-containing protein [Bacillus sp. REN16]|uniref:Wzz/FepE/Etk N-terminal domain-containing protein n=1 Tax=Bacillus sp. REN16 TaxID=2887296 RepID=UPI001E2A3BEE|nr:Wzz/FepE/Etk N-terminal domain-containing protein [Bacillus sp. REN16]MCC3356916.1 hypothetical protein [Bacillus sp. REN16]
MSEQNQYILYGYLQFLWKKKWLIILATVIGMGLGYAYTLTQQTKYTSKAIVFTGMIENRDLSKPEIIQNDYKHLLTEIAPSDFSVAIPMDNQINLTLVGSDKSIVESDLTKIANQIVKDLTVKYDVQRQAMEDYVNALSEQVDATNYLLNNILKESSSGVSKDVMEQLNSDSQLVYLEGKFYNANTKELLYYAGEELAKMVKHNPRISGDDVNTSENKPSSIKFIILGGAAFFQLMLIIVILWKYIINARQFKEM